MLLTTTRRNGGAGHYEPPPAAVVRRVTDLARRRAKLLARQDELVAQTDAAVLELVEDHHLTHAAIASLLGVTDARVGQLVANARKRRASREAAEDAITYGPRSGDEL